MRMKVQLTQCRILEVKEKNGLWDMAFALPNSVTCVSHLTFKPKLSPGDFIELYTEVEADADQS